MINEADNILVCCQKIQIGEYVSVSGNHYEMSASIDVGHKIAITCIKQGEKIMKYGVPIGSAISNIKAGEHVHMHNMKSDYIPSHTRQSVIGQ